MVSLRLRFRAFALVLFSLGLAASGDAPAQTYPSRPVRFVVPYAAGGPTDLAARLIGQNVSNQLGQPVVVENRPGVAAIAGAEHVAKSSPDGYTFLVCANTTLVHTPLLYKKLPYKTSDFEPVALFYKSPFAMTLGVKFPQIASVREFIDYARARPGKINYGTSGRGSVTHLMGELFEAVTGVDMQDIPYKGSAPQINDLLAGQLDLYFEAIPSPLPLYLSGRLRILAHSGDQRFSAAPNIPTFAESGFPDLVVYVWFGLLAPAGVPKPIINRVNASVQTALQTPAIRDNFVNGGAIPELTTPESFDAFIKKDIDKWRQIILQRKIELD